ncbi:MULTISPECIES: peptidoglycan D,D-transpeptidase FtsI family protein [Microbacterium]|uniref:peptidoglycan D,D-transpeptidase FtsI family protein n=1 Tax=Microbacterium TaxID=33882 RepID=UPI00217E1989|nr:MULTISPECIES: penicillin-binding protein 2 [Microbacterium]UWF76780.1 penicillin-binding protein 2 [Microbacterium neungamense]WCM54930.1 penicillin-binding protein 2 [Microbacterium sp. EF45047]
MTTRATRGPRRRTVAALAVILAVLSAFIVRLVDIQVVRADEHVADSLSVGQLGSTQTIAGARGDIVDEKGTVLASSAFVYDAELDPLVITQLEEDEEHRPDLPWAEASDRIADVIGKSGDEVRALVADALVANPQSRWVQLARGLSTQQYLDLRELGLPYLHMPPRSVRVYPNGAVAGNMIGFLNGEGEAQYGVERLEAECLAPTNGERSFLRGKDGVIIPGSERVTPAVDGGTVKLTIDSDLNWYLQQMIAEEAQLQGAKGATVTVVEAETGKIRAAAEYPAVDPNDIEAVDPAHWRSQIFSDAYEPGSTFKAITAAALIDQGAATPLSTVSAADREVFPNGAVINDPFRHGVSQYTLAGALIDSSNVSMSKFGTMVAPEVRGEYLERFGVGRPTAVGFPFEEEGMLTDPLRWDNQTLYTSTFGQGAYTITMAQLAGAYQALANDGEKIDLSLVESCTGADGTVTEAADPGRERVVSADTAAQLRRMLENVAVQGGLNEQVQIPGYRVGLKTGTAQKTDGNGGYKAGVYYTSMVGMAPIEDPKYIVVVSMDEPTRLRSSAATASAFQKAMTQVLKTYRIAPSSQPMDEPLPKFD